MIFIIIIINTVKLYSMPISCLYFGGVLYGCLVDSQVPTLFLHSLLYIVIPQYHMNLFQTNEIHGLEKSCGCAVKCYMENVFLPCFLNKLTCWGVLWLLFWWQNIGYWSLFRVSKGVRDIPGNLQSATSNIPSGKALMYFGLFMATGVFFIFMAFTLFLPVIVLVPQKFAICFTLGCSFIIGSFFALKGPKTQFAHMFSMEVFFFPFTTGLWCCVFRA